MQLSTRPPPSSSIQHHHQRCSALPCPPAPRAPSALGSAGLHSRLHISLPSISSSCSSSGRGRRQLVVQARFSGPPAFSGRPGQPALTDRLLAALPYILPFLNVFTYGRFLFYMYPTLKACMKPILPTVALYHSLPFGSLVAFFGVYLGIVNNTRLSRFVRFNAMQAILLDILLVLPRLVETVLSPPRSGFGLELYAHSQSFVWIFITTWVVFAVASCVMGHWARIPYIADSADAQVR